MQSGKNPQKDAESTKFEQLHLYGERTPREVVMKFCLGVGIEDIITYAKFGEDRLRGLGVATGQISVFPHSLVLPILTTLRYYRASL